MVLVPILASTLLAPVNPAIVKPKNLNLKQITQPCVMLTGQRGDSVEAAAAHFVQFLSNNGTITTCVHDSIVFPGENRIDVDTDAWRNESFGSGFMQSFDLPVGSRFDYWIVVEFGTVRSGPVRTSGEFLDTTDRTYNGGFYEHVTVPVTEPCGGIAFESLTEGPCRFRVTRMRYTPPNVGSG